MRWTALILILGAVTACGVPTHTTDVGTVEELGWADAATTSAPTSTAPAPTTSTSTPVVDPPITTTVPVEGLTWVCRIDGSPAQVDRRHEAFVHNVAISGLPATSRAQVLRQLPAVEANLALYCDAERATGVPALVLAAIHYREANNDPARSIMSGELLGAVNPDTHRVEGTTALDNAVAAADHLAGNAAAFYGVGFGPRTNSIDLAYALAAYNRGGMYCRAGQMHPMRSPYVAGGLTSETVGMSWPDVGGDSGGPEAWGEPPSVRGRPDPRIGALTLMRGLGSEITAPAFAWNTDEVVIRCR